MVEINSSRELHNKHLKFKPKSFMKTDSFLLYKSHLAALQSLSDEQIGFLFRNVYRLLNGETVETDTWESSLRVAFQFIKLQIDIDSEKYLQKTKRNDEKRKWRKEQRNVKSNSQSEETSHARVNENENENGNENGNENENENVSLSFFSKNPKNEEEDEKEKNKEEKIQSFIKFWNDAIDSSGSRLRKVRILTPERRQRIAAIIETFPGTQAAVAINYAMRSQYCNGETQRRTKPVDFDWLMRLENFTKALEGSL